MPSAPALDIKVIYSSSRRRRRGRWIPRAGGPIPRSRLLVLGVVNLMAASGVYYATWWVADPELRIKIIFHTPLSGVDLDSTAGALVPPGSKLAPARTSGGVEQTSGATARVEGTSSDAILFVGTAIGWEALATLAACTLALSGGTLLGRAGGPAWRRGVLILCLLTLAALGWVALGLWTKYERLTPDLLRYGIAVLVVLVALSGLALRRGEKLLTYLAAIALILSAVGSVVALCVGSRYEALNPADLPMPFVIFLALVFVAHSLWGWILLPLASRVGYRGAPTSSSS